MERNIAITIYKSFMPRWAFAEYLIKDDKFIIELWLWDEEWEIHRSTLFKKSASMLQDCICMMLPMKELIKIPPLSFLLVTGCPVTKIIEIAHKTKLTRLNKQIRNG